MSGRPRALKHGTIKCSFRHTMALNTQPLEVLRSVNWFWPAYIRRGYVLDLVSRLSSEPAGPKRTAIFETALPDLYTEGHLAAMLLHRYSVVPMVNTYSRQLSEAIEAAHLGLHHAAVALLIPTIEGIVREHATQGGRDLGNAPAAKLNEELAAMVNHERQAHPRCAASAERVSMIETFSEFLTESLYKHTKLFAGDRQLNRHGTIHGIYRDYGNAANFYVLISVIDLLAFILTFRTSGVSVLAPDVTLQARRLAVYYLALRDIGKTAAAMAGARR
jgi:hypothetical protein